MKIIFESSTGVFTRQTYVDEKTFKKERGVYPTGNEVWKAEGESVYLLTALTNFNILPSKRVLRTDLPQYDGVIHYGALYKAKPFTIRCGRNEGMQTSYRDIYSDRGLFNMTVEDKGITMTMLATALSSDDDYEITLDTPTLLYDVTQSTTLTKTYYEFFNTYADNMYTDPALYTDEQLYTEAKPNTGIYIGGNIYEATFDIAVRDTGGFHLQIDGNTSPIKLYNIRMNGIDYSGQEVILNDNTEALLIESDGTVEKWNDGTPTALPGFNFGGYKSHGNHFKCDIQFTNTTTDQSGYVHSWATSWGEDLTLGGH